MYNGTQAASFLGSEDECPFDFEDKCPSVFEDECPFDFEEEQKEERKKETPPRLEGRQAKTEYQPELHSPEVRRISGAAAASLEETQTLPKLALDVETSAFSRPSRPAAINTTYNDSLQLTRDSSPEDELCKEQDIESYFHFKMMQENESVPDLYLSIKDNHDGVTYLFMEKFDDHLNAQYLFDEKISWSTLSSRLLELIGTLDKQEIIHHDIKAENIFINKNSSKLFFLGDFGLASSIKRVINSRNEIFGGTPTYFTSSKVTGKNWKEYTLKKDLAGLGLTLLRLFIDKKHKKRK